MLCYDGKRKRRIVRGVRRSNQEMSETEIGQNDIWYKGEEKDVQKWLHALYGQCL